MKQFSKKTILYQIFCGILFAFAANPYLIYNLIPSKFFVVFQIIAVSFLLLTAIKKYCKDDIKKAIELGYFAHNKNFFTIFLFASFETIFLGYLWVKYFLKIQINVYVFILLPTAIAFLVVLFLSFLIRKRGY
jgi:hypothetical protein